MAKGNILIIEDNDEINSLLQEILGGAGYQVKAAYSGPEGFLYFGQEDYDLILLDLMQPNMQPENNIVKNIVYSGSKQNVKMTMVNGRILYENGEFFIGFDPKEIYGKANQIIGRMK